MLNGDHVIKIAQAIRDAFTSPNVPDSNMEPANLVDVFDTIGRAMNQVAFGSSSDISTIEAHGKSIEEAASGLGSSINGGLCDVAAAINRLAKAIESRESSR